MKAYVEANFAPELLSEMPLDDQLYELAGLHIINPNPRILSIEPVSETETKLNLLSPLTGRPVAFAVGVEPKSPFRIVDFGRRAATQQPMWNVAPPRTAAALAQAIDQYTSRLAKADYFSGVVLLAQGKHVIFSKAYGLANRADNVPNDLGTRFNVGSMSKMLTALAVAQLVEAGKLSYDDPLAKFIPDYPDPESARKIKIKHLLSHTAGLGEMFDQMLPLSPLRFQTVADYLAVAPKKPLAFQPGTAWSYSSLGMMLAGRIVELVSGEDYYSYVQRHILVPAGIKEDAFPRQDRVNPGLAIGYDRILTDDGPALATNTYLLGVRTSPAGGAYFTAPGLMSLANAIQSGRLVKPSTWQLMSSPKTELHSPIYGYGVMRSRFARERDIVGHGGDMDGACAAFDMFRDTPEPYTLVILANSTQGSCHALDKFIIDLLPPRGRKPA